MGTSASNAVGYKELRNSIPGSLVQEEDCKLFYSLCKVESQRTISTVLLPHASQLFYVVLSGEVLVQLSCPEVKSTVVTTYSAGETIHFFNAPLRGNASLTGFDYSDSSDCIRNGDIKLSLHFRTVGKVPGRVIGIDRRSMEQFLLKARSNVHALTSFVDMSMASLFQSSPFCKTMSPEQAHIFGPLLKLRLAHTGREVGAHIPPAPIGSNTGTPQNKQGDDEGHVIMVLHGGLLSIPSSHSTTAIVNHLISQELPVSKHTSGPLSGFKVRAPPVLPAATSTTGAPKVFKVTDLDRASAAAQDSDSGRGRTNLALSPGSFVGSDQYCIRNPGIRPRTILVSTASVLGYISFAALDVLFQMDPRFQRVYWRNFYMLVINWVKFSNPFLLDMDEWGLALLSCKLSMIGVNAGEPIKKQGAPSDYAFILLGGAAIESIAEKDGATPTATLAMVKTRAEDRVVKWGSMFGVMALTTNQPYFASVIATEPCLVLRLSKRVLDQIYYNNKAKLCEIRIRLMGANVDLLHAIDHPKGGDLFLQYLTRERAAENLTFYRTVDRFDAMCAETVKQHALVRKTMDRYIEEQAAAVARLIQLNETAQSAEGGEGAVEGETATDKVYSVHVTPGNNLYSTQSKKLTPIISASNLSTSAKEEEAPRQLSVKLKPAGGSSRRSVPSVRQSSFSGRVAVALNEAEEHLHEETSADVSDGDLNESPPVEEQGVGSAEDAAALEVAELHAGNPVAAVDDAAGPGAGESSNALQGEREHSPRAEGVQGGGASPERALGAEAVAAAGDGDAIAGNVTPKRYHRSSFLKEKQQEVAASLQSHIYADASMKVDAAEPEQRSASTRGRPPGVSSKKDRGLAKLNRQIHQVLGSIVELKEVARSIMETFVYQGSENELNLPGALRVRCERQFNDWNTDLASILRAQHEASHMGLAAPSTDTTNEESGDFSAATPTNLMRNMSIMSGGSNAMSVNFKNSAQGPGAGNKRLVSISTLGTSADSVDASVGTPSYHNTLPSPGFHSFAAGESAATGLPTFFSAGTNSDASQPSAQACEARGMASVPPSAAARSARSAASPGGGARRAGSMEVQMIPLESIDLSFVELFREAKQEILKLLRDDKFPRWKATREFQAFIANVKPYDETSLVPKGKSGDDERSYYGRRTGMSLDSAGL